MNLGPCPTCGTCSYVYQAVRVTGSAEVVYGQQGHKSHVRRGRERLVPHSDAVRCGVCHRIRRDWQAVDGELVRQGE